MSENANLNAIVSSSIELLESEIGTRKVYPDRHSTSLSTISRDVADELLAEGCEDKAALVAASLGDLPYSVSVWKHKGVPAYGKLAGEAYHQLSTLRSHGHINDCVKKTCDCNDSMGCDHGHVKGCAEHECVLHRMVSKAPYMNGSARAALMAWFSVMAARVTHQDHPKQWNEAEKATYLHRISAVAQAVVDNGTRVKLSPVIKRLGKKVEQLVRDFQEHA